MRKFIASPSECFGKFIHMINKSHDDIRIHVQNMYMLCVSFKCTHIYWELSN